MKEKNLFEVIQQVRELTDKAVIGFSGGKDGLVALDLCKKLGFKQLSAFFMYLVPDLSFQNEYFDAIERQYDITIHRVPHVALSGYFKNGMYRFHSSAGEIPYVSLADMRLHIRNLTGIEWILSGEKKTDSLTRRAWLARCNGVQEKQRLAYPVADWSDKNIWAYVNLHRLPIAPDYRIMGRSFHIEAPETIINVHNQYPEDYQRIKAVFPFVESVVAKARFAHNHVQQS